MERCKTARRTTTLALFGLLLPACAPKPIEDHGGPPALDAPADEPNSQTDAGDSQVAPASADTIDSSALALQASQETIYVWGGLYTDATLDAPVPLTAGVLAPGDRLEFVRVHCLIRGPQDKAKARCRAAGRNASPAIAESWHERAHACTELHERAATRKEIATIQAKWVSIVAGPDFKTKGMAWSVSRYEPPALKGKPTLLEVAITHEWKGPERVGAGCDNVPADHGCDPVVIETGRTITLSRDAVRYGYSAAPDVALGQLFGGRAPLLHRIRIGSANPQGYVEEHPILKIEGSRNGIEDYRRRQLAALGALAAAATHRPDLLAAVQVNRAIAALHLKDLALLQVEVDALRALLAEYEVDRAGLMLDNTLAYFDRILAGEWLLEDPCPV